MIRELTKVRVLSRLGVRGGREVGKMGPSRGRGNMKGKLGRTVLSVSLEGTRDLREGGLVGFSLEHLGVSAGFSRDSSCGGSSDRALGDGAAGGPRRMRGGKVRSQGLNGFTPRSLTGGGDSRGRVRRGMRVLATVGGRVTGAEAERAELLQWAGALVRASVSVVKT